jgi:hypothetical protein
MISLSLLNAVPAALQLPVSGLPGAIACFLLFALSCVARAQTGRMSKRARRVSAAKPDEPRGPGGGGCDRKRL